MTCRDELLTVIHDLVADRPDKTFWLYEVIERLYATAAPESATYSATTIRMVLTQQMCVNALRPRDGGGADVERLDRGQYRLLSCCPQLLTG